jgi:hypothetical protein
MPQFNQGIVPGGAIGNELAAVTRRAFLPYLTVQLYSSTPTLSLLLRNAQKARGGLSQITVPVQGSQFVNFAWSDYSGTFTQPSVQTAVTNAEFNMAMGMVPIPFLGAEAMIQSTEAIIPLLKARMADAKTVMMQQISTNLFANNSNVSNGSQIIRGLPEAFDDGTNVQSYGGINRSTSSFWKGQLVASAGGVLTRGALTQKLLQATKAAGGESPDFGIMSFSDYATLLTEAGTAEQYVSGPGSKYSNKEPVNANFRAITIGNTPFYPDPFCPKGTIFLPNSKYLAMYLHEDVPFAFSGWQSLIGNLQFGYIGLVIVALQVVATKPSSGMLLTGVTGGSF